MPRFVSTLLIAVLTLSGCHAPTGSQERRPGTLVFHGDPVHVEMPDSVTAGVPFQLRVRTYGGGCTRQGETDVTVRGRTAEIRPYDYEPMGGRRICPAILSSFEHVASLTFAEAGEATIRVHGWKEPEQEPLTVTRATRVHAKPAS